jgi:predicted dehydrogenase
VAIIGAGMIGPVHARAARHAGGEVIGALASSGESAARAAVELGAERAFASLDELLDSPAEVVHICTPNALHHHYAAAALRAGKHVICEKPLGISSAEAAELTALAEDSDLVGAVPFVYRFHPLVRELRARRLAGEFGRVLALHGSYLQDWLRSPAASNWRVSPDMNGASRAFADIGSHWCDLVEWVSGERIGRLTAATSTVYAARPAGGGAAFSESTDAGELAAVETEDIAALVFETRSGVLGNAVISQVSAGRKNRLWFELDGSACSAVFDQENPDTVWLGDAEGARILFRDPRQGDSDARRLSILPAGHGQGFADCFNAFVADAYAAIDGDHRTGLPTFADGLRSMRLVEAVVESATSNEWRTVE